MKITIDGYLTQKKLEKALLQIIGPSDWRGREINAPKSKRRWDMAFSKDGSTIVVEYDGDAHYCNSLKIKIDEEKDLKARELGFKVVRFPYWVQLTSETLGHYFHLQADIMQSFPHGFITTKIFPASFCPLGLERFAWELQSLPDTVRNNVIDSLRKRSIEHGVRYVVPDSLRSITEQ